jgi:hypothetical protein
MKQSAILTLWILKSLYPRADFDATGEGFTTTCSDDEALKLIEDSARMAVRIIDMLPLDMSQGTPLHNVCNHFVYFPPCKLVV